MEGSQRILDEAVTSLNIAIRLHAHELSMKELKDLRGDIIDILFILKDVTRQNQNQKDEPSMT